MNEGNQSKFNVRSVLHGQVNIAAVNRTFVIHEAMNGSKNLKINLGLLLKCKYMHMYTIHN